jgi:putative Mg2+ transporter-C (MgtC) family protein
MNLTLTHAVDVAFRLTLAVAIGGIIGLNRWLRHKPAGFGTHALVSLGAALATIVMSNSPGADAQSTSRVIQGLVTGVGFIGAGVIMREEHSVHGLTTAASIWISAILGISCGSSDFLLATFGIVFALAVLLISKPFEDRAARVFKREDEH